MKILMVYDYISDSLEGGSDRILYEHSKRLKAKGHLLKVIASSDREYFKDDFFEKDGIDILRYRVGRNRLPRLFQTMLGARRLFSKLSKEIKFDIINFHQPLSAFPVLCKRQMKDFFKVYTFHSPWHGEYEAENGSGHIFYRANSFLRKKIERFCLHRCDKIIVLSEYMKKELIEIHAVEEEKVKIIPGGIDTEKFKPSISQTEIRKRLSLPADKFIIFSMRALRKRTGLFELLNAALPLLKYDDNMILVIAGGGPCRNELEGLVKRLGLGSKVILTGFVSEELLPCYYQASDLFVMPTQQLEGFGLALLEALSSGLPVLATPVGAIPEVLGGLDKRCLFKNTSQSSLSEGLEEIIGDNNMRKSMIAAARDYAIGRYSWDTIMPRFEKELMREG